MIINYQIAYDRRDDLLDAAYCLRRRFGGRPGYELNWQQAMDAELGTKITNAVRLLTGPDSPLASSRFDREYRRAAPRNFTSRQQVGWSQRWHNLMRLRSELWSILKTRGDICSMRERNELRTTEWDPRFHIWYTGAASPNPDEDVLAPPRLWDSTNRRYY